MINEASFKKALDNLRRTVEDKFPKRDIPRRRLFAFKYANGWTEREVAINEEGYRRGVELAVREAKWYLVFHGRENDD